MTVLLAILAFVVGLVMCHYVMVKPLEETEVNLRQELRKLRGELWANGIEISNLRTWVIMHHQFQAPNLTPEGRISHRARSDVLRIHSIDDLIEGTKP